jgi:hypothetical protein
VRETEGLVTLPGQCHDGALKYVSLWVRVCGHAICHPPTPETILTRLNDNDYDIKTHKTGARTAPSSM